MTFEEIVAREGEEHAARSGGKFVGSFEVKTQGPAKKPSTGEYWWTIEEIVAEWNMSRDTVIRLFENEPGRKIKKQSSRFKRRYRTFWIPDSVKNRVENRLTNN
jgi:hypothetical protein